MANLSLFLYLHCFMRTDWFDDTKEYSADICWVIQYITKCWPHSFLLHTKAISYLTNKNGSINKTLKQFINQYIWKAVYLFLQKCLGHKYTAMLFYGRHVHPSLRVVALKHVQ